MFARRPRLSGFEYAGRHRYFLTFCTCQRLPHFSDPATVAAVLTTMRQSSAAHGFEILAYCFMPDHLHLVMRATHDTAALPPFVSHCKQLTGYAHRRRTGAALWQPSYYDHVLRDDESTDRAVRYTLENPVRKGLVKAFEEYPFSGSDVFDTAQLRELWAGWNARAHGQG